MRYLFFVLLLSYSVSFAAAQSPLARRAFDDATRLANAGQFEKALKGYRAAMTASDGSSNEFIEKIRYNLGTCYYRTGRLDAAFKEFGAAIQLSGGKNEKAYYGLGMTESARENWAAARKAFLKAVDLRPSNGEAWFDLALIHLAERDYDRAAAAFRKSIENRSVDAALGHNNLGVIMAMKHEFEAAERSFAAALEASGGSLIEARQNLDLCRMMQNDARPLVAVVELKFVGRET